MSIILELKKNGSFFKDCETQEERHKLVSYYSDVTRVETQLTDLLTSL